MGGLDGKVLNEPGNDHIMTKETKMVLNEQVLHHVQKVTSVVLMLLFVSVMQSSYVKAADLWKM